MSVGGRESHLPRHPLGGNDQDTATHLFNQLAQIVEQVIDFRVAQVSECDLAGRTVQPAGNLAVSLYLQRGDLADGGGLGDLGQVVTAMPLGSGLFELLAQLGQPRLILRLDGLPDEGAEFRRRHRVGVDRDPLGQKKWVVADLAETVMVLRQRRQDQRQARRLGMVLQHRPVDGSEEPIGIGVFHLLRPALAVVRGPAHPSTTAIRGDRLVRLGEPIARGVGDCPHHFRSWIDLVEHVSVPLKELNLAQAQPEHLIPVGRLPRVSQGLGMKAIGHDDQFDHRPLKPEHSKQGGLI